MPNMLTNFICQFLKPATNRTWTDDIITDCSFTPISASQKNWAKFNGILYDYKVCVILSGPKQAEITEDWRIKISGIEYSIKDITHKSDNTGYDHSVFNISKIQR